MIAAVLFFLLLGKGAARIDPWKPFQRDPLFYLNLPHIKQAEERLQVLKNAGTGVGGRAASNGTAATNVDVTVDLTQHINEVSEGYLSVTMDALQLREHLNNVNFSAPSFISTARGLSPAVFRVGGTDGDYAIYFHSTGNGSNATNGAGGNYTVSAEEWDTLNQFVQKVGWHLVYGLNLKLRAPWPMGAWNSSNAIELMKYSKQKGYNVSWELGNEPSLYKGPVLVSSTQLAEDFKTLRQAVDQYSISKFTIGPDTLVHEYIHDFLHALEPGVLDAITYHSYFTSGPTATLSDLTNVTILDTFTWKAVDMALAASGYYPSAELWLGETGDLNRHGNPVLSPSYAAGFFWLQTLGVGAVCNLKRVLRQDFIGLNYSLLSPDYVPRPSYWLSYVHKQIVGTRVLYVQGSLNQGGFVRVFAHCSRTSPSGSVVLLILNLNSTEVSLTLKNPELASSSRDVYWLTPPSGNLTSTDILLNGGPLQLGKESELPPLKPVTRRPSSVVSLPPLSYGFYVFTEAKAPACT